MVKADPLVQVFSNENEHIVAGSGELHLEICLNDLMKEYTNNMEIIKSEPVVPYKETITTKSKQVCMAKSGNNHNRISMVAEPLSEQLTNDIENGKFFKQGEKIDIKNVYKSLVDKYDWDSHDAKKLFAFGPDTNGSNVLVDQTSGIQFLNEIRDSMESSFNWVTREGILADENMRGIKFNIVDAVLHADAVHRGGAQIIPAARRVYYASQLTAEPRFLEPIYLIDITTYSDVVGTIYQCFSQRRGIIYSEEYVSGTTMLHIKGYLPVKESFGFSFVF
jgi:elongation factor 2